MTMSRCTGCCPAELLYADGDLTLVYNDCGEQNSVSIALPMFGLGGCVLDRLEMGKMGPVTADGETIANLPLTPTSTIDDSVIVDAVAVLGRPGAGTTTFVLYTVTPAGVATVLGEPTGYSIAGGDTQVALPDLVVHGTTIDAGDSVGVRVTVGSDAVDLNVTLWVRICGIEEEPVP